METNQTYNFKIMNTTLSDWSKVIELFNKTTELQGKNGYRVWGNMDESVIENDIKNGLHRKIIQNDDIVCIFSIQNKDALMASILALK